MFMLATGFWEGLIEGDLIIAFVAIAGGITVAITAIVFTCVKEMIVQNSREHTRREIAAYVAEGSIDPDKAIAMLSAGNADAEA